MGTIGRRSRLVGWIASVGMVLGLSALLVGAWAGPAGAHEGRQVGRYRFVVGFGDEPAYAGQKNSVQLLLSDTRGKPVTNLGDTLEVMVMAGRQTQDLALEPFFEVGEFGTPGDYRAFFIPTRPGKYTFHFTGTIQGEKVDKKFTSVTDGFAEVEDPAKAQFPIKQPSTVQLSERLDREVQRANDAVAAAQNKADDQVATVRLVAIVGLVVGLAGLGVGVFALTRKRA